MTQRRIPNIVYSTTRSWNCGDDFILFGVRRLVEAVLPAHNPVVFNRNPDLIIGRTSHDHERFMEFKGPSGPFRVRFNPYEIAKPFFCQWDNSVRASFDGRALDACIFAGTPEWSGPPVEPLVRLALQHRLPTAYLGIGSHQGLQANSFAELAEADRELLTGARLVTVRDGRAEALLAPVQPRRRPCPSIHAAAGTPRGNRAPLRIALSLQTERPDAWQSMERKLQAPTVALFRALAARADCTLVLHYVDELPELGPLLGDLMPVRYAYDPQDYLRIYAGFDLAVTTRVHGAGVCAALGIPAYVVGHSARSETAEGFLARLIDPRAEPAAGLAARIAATDVTSWSAAILRHQAEDRAQMVGELRRFFDGAGLLRADLAGSAANPVAG